MMPSENTEKYSNAPPENKLSMSRPAFVLESLKLSTSSANGIPGTGMNEPTRYKAMIANVKKIWTDVMNKKEFDLKEITLYLKTDDNAAYYVINGEVTGKINL